MRNENANIDYIIVEYNIVYINIIFVFHRNLIINFVKIQYK